MPESQPSTDLKRKLVAICGKGGVGKTALTALMMKIIVGSGSKAKLLAIDADPAMGLPIALGVHINRSMGEVRDEIIRTARTAKDERKTELANMLDYMVFEALMELDGYSLIAMGRSEASGCYCPVNDLLRAAIEDLSKGFDIVLIDGEAGLEQLNRKVMRNIDTLITVTDLSARGLQVVDTIRSIAQTGKVIKCKRIGMVINRVRDGEGDKINEFARKIDVEILGHIPEDVNIAKYDLIGKPILDINDASPSIVAVRDIVNKLDLAN